jgi:hypothetical protein
MSSFFTEIQDWQPLSKEQVYKLWKSAYDNARNGSGGGNRVTDLRKQGFSETEIKIKANIKEFNLTKDYVQWLWCNQKGRCDDLNILIDPNELFIKGSTFSPSLDRINDKMGYVEGNVRIVFRFLNLGRSKTPITKWKIGLSRIKENIL